MHPKYKTRDFDLIDIAPPSSFALKERIDSIIVGSQKWTATVETLDLEDGTYRIVLQGRLRDGRNFPGAV